MIFGTDIVDHDFYRSKEYKLLGHYSGLLMIFSGIVCMVLIRRQLEREHAHSQTKELNQWLRHFSLKFFLGVLLTPFVDRIVRIVNFGVSSGTPSS
jgi:cytochrome c biogenesis protein CcdA